MDKKIYLCGAMAAKNYEDAMSWRKEATDYAEIYIPVENAVFNPMLYFNYEMDQDDFSDKECFRYEKRMLPECGVLLVNLEDIEKSVGSIHEIAWAFDHDIPIIAFHRVYTDEQVFSKVHPWILEEVDRFFTGENSIDEAVSYISSYYYDA